MATCTLCGNEEIEKPKDVVLYIPKYELADGRILRQVKTIRIPFGSYCWSKKRKECLHKVDEIKKIEMQLKAV